ncbi:MAG: aminomethyl-transferring glycine dehydrogenase subunit GcvPA [bacterium]
MYIPHKQHEVEKIKNELKIKEINDIFEQITGKNKFFEPNELGEPLSQQSLINFFDKLASKIEDYEYLVGAGAYDYFIPPIVESLIRAEFVTSYTPYQPEVSQGTLKALWDFQSAICEIFNQEVCNSSHYDTATATAEAVLMAKRIYHKKKPNANTYIVANSVHPTYQNVLKTYTQPLGIQPKYLEFNQYGKIDIDALSSIIDDDVFAIVIQSPNFFGVIENNIPKLKDIAQDRLVILVVSNPFFYFLQDPPQVDIVVSNLQPFGIPLSFGGPYLATIATSLKNIREMPGRIIGKTIDKDGKEAYTMILQTREQHIKREKATSNICTNQTLMAIRNIIYLMAMGKSNLIKVAQKSYTNIRHLSRNIEQIGSIKVLFNDVFNETLLYVPNYHQIYKHLKKNHKIIFGISLNKFKLSVSFMSNLRKYFDYELSNLVLVCTTEKISKQKIDQIVSYISEFDVIKNGAVPKGTYSR